MPLKKSFKKSVKKSVKKYVKKPNLARANLVKLIKSVSLKPVETKNTHKIDENNQLFHNVPFIAVSGHLNTTLGTGDDNSGTSNFAGRIGDEVIARGLSYKFWFANKADRPNVMYKIIFFKHQSNITPASPAPYFSQGTTNYMIRDIDTEKYKILKVIKFKLENNAQRITAQDTFFGAEGHKALSVWIPLKNMRVKYENNSSIPRFFDYGYTIVAYDSYGTLTTDNIASFAVNRKFYFKDP